MAQSGDAETARRDSTVSRKLRASTWSDSELEELYDVYKMSPDTASKTKHLLAVMKAIRHCNKAKNLDDAISVVVRNTCDILGCDRATLFIVDEIREELVIRQAVGVEDIRISLDSESIAGSVYQSGVKLNIPDAYKDPRFNKDADSASGYKTNSILCTPIWDANYEPVAVLQAVNKFCPADPVPAVTSASPPAAPAAQATSAAASAFRLFRKKQQASSAATASEQSASEPAAGAIAGERPQPTGQTTDGKPTIPFTTEDEVLMDHLSLQLGVILRNQMLREQSERSHKQVSSLLDIVRSLHSNMGVNSLMFTITERSPSLVDADRCTLYVVDRRHDELWSLQGAIEIRVPLSKGLVGYTATTGQVINIEDAHKDSRFNTEFDLKTGFRTKSVLVMPIKERSTDGRDGEVVGVLQVINKLHGPRFTDEDEQLLGSFLDIVGSLLMTSQLFASSLPKPTEFGAARDLISGSTPKRSNSSTQLHFPDMIAEDDEEDEEEHL